MKRLHSLLDVYEQALGETPSSIVKSGRSLGAGDLAALLTVNEGRRAATFPLLHDAVEGQNVLPLISHHRGARALFGASGDIRPRALALLLMYDGLVVADPLVSVRRTLKMGTEAGALAALAQTTRELADVEPLMARGLLVVARAHPQLDESSRRTVLETFGLDPGLRVFTDFVEAGASVDVLGARAFQRHFAPQVMDLYAAFGLPISAPADLGSAVERVRRLAAAILEVSWQVAVASTEHVGEVAPRGALELHLATAALSGGRMAATRHFDRLQVGGVPNLDTSRLSVADAIAIREGDAFSAFRSSLRSAMDDWVEWEVRGGAEAARQRFEERMRDESTALARQSRGLPLRDVIGGPALTAAVSVVAQHVAGEPVSLVSGAAVAATSMAVGWSKRRRDERGSAVAHRYLLMLGGCESRTWPRAGQAGRDSVGGGMRGAPM